MAGTSRYLDGLNPPQREAVLQTDGPLLVIAGAGSGKTRVVTRRIAYIISKKLAPPSGVLAVTFTNKAAGEMRERVSELIGKKRGKEVVLSTFHSFCLGVLREHIEHLGFRKNFTVTGEGDTRTLIRRVLDDIDGPQEAFSPGVFRERISLAKGANGTSDLEAEPTKDQDADATESDVTETKYRQWLPEVYERYQSALRAANALDFDDLLSYVLKLWDEHPRILARYQKRFQYVMVDEYQDTNPVQYAIVQRLVAKHNNLCVVGDDDQSIYGWRGADVRNILGFEKDYPGAKIITLAQNYRSTKTILAAANAVIANNSQRRVKETFSRRKEGRAIDWMVVGDDEHEAKLAAKWLVNVREKARAKFSDFAVLYRSNNQARAFEITFRNAQIPYVVIGGQEFFERAEVRDIVAYLKVLANPYDETSFLRIVNMPRRGIGDKTLHAVHDLCREQDVSFGKGLARALKDGRVSGPAEEGVRELLALLKEIRERLRAGKEDLSDLVGDLVRRIQYKAELERTSKSLEQAGMRWENVEAILKAMADYESTTPDASLRGFLDASALDTDADRLSKDERRGRAVTLMTMHGAKGLEFPFVFIVGCEEGLVPHERSLRDGTIEEERRLFYVGLTRAERHITLFEAHSRTRHGRTRMNTTSRFLAELPPELVTQRIHAARDMVEARVEPNKDLPKPKRRRKRAAAKLKRG